MSSPTNPWYIVFYTTDSLNQKLIRRRVLHAELAGIENIDMRRAYAHQAIEEINALLYDDWHTESLEAAPKILQFDFRHFTILQAIDYVSAYKRDVEDLRENSVKAYSVLRTTVKDFLQHHNLPQDFRLREVNGVFLRMYFDYLKQVRKIANKTYNGHRASLHAVLAVLIDRDKSLFKGTNPVAGIRMLSTNTRKHAAYSDEQMEQLHAALKKAGEHHLIFFIQVMYYSLARPEELRHLQVGHIDLENRRILFRDETAKTGIEQHVGINDTFAAILQESGVLKFPPSSYLFSNNGFHGGWGRKAKAKNPGPTPVGKSFFYKSLKPFITTLGFYKVNPNYTVYSFKHTGAIALYRATRDIKLVQAQCRHQSIEQTNTYLRDLGALNDFELLNQWKGPI